MMVHSLMEPVGGVRLDQAAIWTDQNERQCKARLRQCIARLGFMDWIGVADGAGPHWGQQKGQS